MITVNEAKRLIKRAILSNLVCDKPNLAITPLVSGKHGIGKSAMIKSIADELGGVCITVEGGTLKEGEITGLPYQYKDDEGRVRFRFLPYYAVERIQKTARALSYLDCLQSFAYLAEKNVSLFTRHQVFTREELSARHDMKLDLYNKVIHIEAATMISMLRKDILPAVSQFSGTLAEYGARKSSFCPGADTSYETSAVMKLSSLLADAAKATQALEQDLSVSDQLLEVTELSYFCRDRILPDMEALRALADEMETMTAKEAWPYPSYGDLLFSVN